MIVIKQSVLSAVIAQEVANIIIKLYLQMAKNLISQYGRKSNGDYIIEFMIVKRHY
jgi:hypothetical protein